MTGEEYAAKEMRRLGTLLTETDPRTDDYLILLRSVECFANAAGALVPFMGDKPTKDVPDVEDMGTAAPFPTASKQEETKAEEPYPEAEPTPFPEEESAQDNGKTYTLADVRKALAEAKKTGTNVAEFIKTYGVDNVTAIPATKYAEIMAKLGKA